MAVPTLRETPVMMRDAIVPYTAAGLNMLAATLVTRDIVSPQALLVAFAMILCGLPCSLFFRQRRYNRITLNLLIMGPLLLLTWALVRGLPGLQLNWSNPIESIITRESADFFSALIHILVIIAAGRAFLLVTPRDLLQTPIPGVSIFLLAAITPLRTHPSGNDPLTLGCLSVLLATTLYLFGQSHSQAWFSWHIPLRIQRQLLLWIVQVVLVLFPLVVLLGLKVQPFNMMNMVRTNANHRYPQWRLHSLWGNQAGITMENSIEMGGENWPNGSQVMMLVQLDRPRDLLWRASTYATYKDGTWYNDRQYLAQRLAWQQGGPTAQVSVDVSSDPGMAQALREKKITVDDPSEPTYGLVRQNITIMARTMGSMAPVYGAFQILRFETEHEFYPGININHDGGLSAGTAGMIDHTFPRYGVVSVVKPPPSVLHLDGNPQLSNEEQHAYLRMPNALKQPVQDLALRILAERGLTPHSDPTSIVQRFEAYLGDHYRYTLKPAPPKHHADPILDFLFRQKKGYCNYFSGAMVMLCRSVGIPARFAVGFATGEPLPGDGRTGVTYKVTAAEAHSWVEVYLPHYGWYTSDPTAGSTEEPTVLGKTWDILTSMVAIIKETVQQWVQAYRQNPSVRARLSLGVALLFVLLAVVLYWRRERPPAYPRRPLSPEEARTAILQAYRRMHRWMVLWGITKPDGCTAAEFEAWFRELHPAIGQTVGELCQLYIRVQYSTDTVTDADARRSIALLHTLWDARHTLRHLSASRPVSLPE